MFSGQFMARLLLIGRRQSSYNNRNLSEDQVNIAEICDRNTVTIEYRPPSRPEGANGFCKNDSGSYKIATSQASSVEHTSELQSLMRVAHAVFCMTNKKTEKQSERTYLMSIWKDVTF